MCYKKLEDVCISKSSNIAQKDLVKIEGDYPIYGASGIIKYVDFFKQQDEYIGIIKDGAGVGRVYLCQPKSSVISTMQYIIPNNQVITKYLYYVLTNMNLQSYKTGATIPHIYFRDYKKATFYLHGKKQQQKIINELDIINSLIRIKNEELLCFEHLVKSQFIEMFGGSITNDKGFPIVNLLDISESFIGLTYKPEDVSNKGTIVLRSSNIQNGQLDFNDTVRVDKQIREKLIVKQNDILMCSRNGSSRLVGKVALINRLKEEMTFGAFMSIIRSEHYRYLLTYFELDAFRRQIVTGATTTVNQITQNMLSKIYLPLPPIDLQNKYEKFAVQIDKSKFIVQQQIEQLNNLLNSKMNEYFG